ncbi:MAG: prealbumin-like fold domain-containing protein [Alphaproteobacteria bacterium]
MHRLTVFFLSLFCLLLLSMKGQVLHAETDTAIQNTSKTEAFFKPTLIQKNALDALPSEASSIPQPPPPSTTRKLMDLVERLEEDILIFTVTLGNSNLIDGFQTYYDYDAEKAWVPLSSIASILEFPIKVDAKNGTAKGWFIDENRQFLIDLKNELIIADGKEFKAKTSFIERHEDDLYIDSKMLEELFPLSLKINLLNIAFEIKSKEPLPIEMRREKEKRRDAIHERLTDEEDLSPPMIVEDNFSGPLIDLSVAHSVSEKNEFRTKTTSYSIVGQGILMDLDTMVSYNDSTTPNTDPIIRMHMGQKDPKGNLLGFAKEFIFGDIFSPSVPLVTSFQRGRGGLISNFQDARLSESNKITLSGELPVGWEVEVYRNGSLLAFEIEGKDGEYNFDNLPTISGFNTFKLVFYGPQGQRREEEKSLFIDPYMNKTGKLSINFSILEENKNVVETNNQNTSTTNKGILRGIFLADYGITDLVSFSGAASFFQNRDTGEDRNFYNLGLKSSFWGTLLEISTAFDNEGSGPAVHLSAQTNILGWSIFAEHNEFNQMRSDLSIIGNELLKSSSSARLNGSFALWPLGRFPFSIAGSQKIKESGADETTVQGRLYHNLGRFRFSWEAENTKYFTDENKTTGTFNVSTREGKWELRGGANYNFRPEKRLTSSHVTSSWRFGDDINTFIKWHRDYYEIDETEETTTEYELDDALDTYSIGASNYFDFGSLGVEAKMTSKEEYSGTLNYSVGLALNPRSNTIDFWEKGHKETGAVAAQIYFDRDNNGVFSEGDTPAKDISFNSHHANKKVKTDDEGHAFLVGFQPYQDLYVAIDQRSLEADFSWLPAKKRFKINHRPGAILSLDMPIVQTGDLEGTVFMEHRGKLLKAKGFTVIVFDINNNPILKQETEEDGYFLFERLPLGRYTLKFEEEQLAEFNYAQAPQKFTLTTQRPQTIIDRIVLRKIVEYSPHLSPQYAKTNTPLPLRSTATTSERPKSANKKFTGFPLPPLPTVTVLGMIKDSNGHPIYIENVHVRSLDDPRKDFYLSTNEDGRFVIPETYNGRYAMILERFSETPMLFTVPKDAVGDYDIGIHIFSVDRDEYF